METITEKIVRVIVKSYGVEECQVTNQASFTRNLGADSLDVAEFIIEIGKELNITIPDEVAESITTVGQAIAYIEKVRMIPRAGPSHWSFQMS